MTNSKPNILGLIPARGGSKGIPGKNLIDLGGKPLIDWTIQAAQSSKHLTRIIVSTDDLKISSVATSLGSDVPFLRPKEISGDETPMIDVACHALNALDESFEHLVLLQPTSPFRSPADIDACIDICLEKKVPSCVSIVETEKSPYWMYDMNEAQQLQPIIGDGKQFTRRQDVPKTYALNGAVYVSKVDRLLEIRQFVSQETAGYVMPPDRSIDIDTPIQLKFAQLCANQQLN
jgi:CMP-N,N'-diacetyllegionaminic acid synthase